MKPRALKSLTTDELILRSLNLIGQDIGLSGRDFYTLSHRFRAEGLPFATKTLPKLSKALLAGLSNGTFVCPTSFKKRPRSALPAFLGSLFIRIFHENGHLRDDACPVAVLSIRQLCEAFYKADLPRKKEDDQAVIDNFVAVENELADLTLEDDAILRVASCILSDLSVDCDKLSVRHGPGSTANVDIVDKFDHKLSAAIPSVSYFGEYFFFNDIDAMERLDRFPVWCPDDYFRTRSVAKVVLVPKDSRGPRLISKEPAENQWIQQGILSQLVRQIENHHIFGGQINFTDQSINRRLAEEGSITLEWSTLDLKDASDRVSMVLVEKLFRASPILQVLKVVRSQMTELPDGRNVRLHKHAPMGSALCFPIMALSIYSLLLAGLLGLGVPFEEARRMIYVYGDDIVIKTKYAKFAMDLLERYSLRVNRDKSFISSPFLESCGMDSFKGNNVTPIRFRKCDLTHTKCLLREKPTVLVSILETANLLQEYGLNRASEFLYTYSECWLGALPYGSAESPYLCRRVSKKFPIAEANFLNKRIRWRKAQVSETKPEGYNPLGAEMKGWSLRTPPVKRAGGSHIYAHFLRVWNSMGTSDCLPKQGWFSLPRTVILTRGWFDHYSVS